MTSRVFVVQNSQYRDRVTGQIVEKYDLRPAEVHGRLVTLLGSGKIIADRAPQAIRQMAEVLRTFTPDDFILAIGDPAAIAGACMIAAEKTGGLVKLLRWDRATNTYEVVPLDIGV